MSEEKKGGFFRSLFKRFNKDEAVKEAVQSEIEAQPEPESSLPPDSAPPIQAPPQAPPQTPPVQPEPSGEDEQVRDQPSSVEADEQPAATEKTNDPKSEAQQSTGWVTRLSRGLSKSSRSLTTGITEIFTKRKLDSDTLEQLEDMLIQADLGIETSMNITQAVGKGRYDKQVSPEEVNRILADEIEKVLAPVAVPFEFDDARKPFVILVVGVNGAGKTTTIGKLAAIASREDFSITIAAGDTFRAAAIDQLKVWSDRVGADFLSHKVGSDAASLAFDAMRHARANKTDILMIDTAGRLQNRSELMDELQKIVRVLKKHDETAPHSVLLVLDATVGQNAISQVEAFQKTAGVTGLIMTKLDGTARGGILVALAAKFGIPIHAIGVGEEVDDLQSFDAGEFAQAIVGINTVPDQNNP